MPTLFNSLGALAVIAIAVLQFDTSFYNKPYGHAIVISLAAFASVSVIAAAVFTVLESRKREKRELARDAVLENLAIQAVASKSPHSPEVAPLIDSTRPLRDKVMGLAHDLFAFLKEQGPEPPDPINHLQTTDRKWKEIWERYGPYVDRIHHDYLRLYRDRAVSLFHELGARGIQIPEMREWEIDPPQAVKAANVRKLAEQLLLLATRMD